MNILNATELRQTSEQNFKNNQKTRFKNIYSAMLSASEDGKFEFTWTEQSFRTVEFLIEEFGKYEYKIEYRHDDVEEVYVLTIKW